MQGKVVTIELLIALKTGETATIESLIHKNLVIILTPIKFRINLKRNNLNFHNIHMFVC